ncbi:MAG: dihydropteroate synthase [Paracoccaceae bacterium]|jgi:dihydropteroate synthase
MRYLRPLLQRGSDRPENAVNFCDPSYWFTECSVYARDDDVRRISVGELSDDELRRLTHLRADIQGMKFNKPIIMGILNTTPDSFSDGGHFDSLEAAERHGKQMQNQGADLIDVGGESTRPGADYVEIDEEIARTAPKISRLASALSLPMSIDTRKAAVARAAIDAGACIVNDVSGFMFDPDLAPYCAAHNIPVCIMHAQGDPKTMQDHPTYDNVVMDVYDFLEQQILRLEQLGLDRRQIIADPGIGFGKTLSHNLELLNHIGVFHSLGVPILLGVSRKGMIKTISGAEQAADRAPGSIAVALAARAQGVQIFRVHDVAETKQAFDLFEAVEQGYFDGT